MLLISEPSLLFLETYFALLNFKLSGEKIQHEQADFKVNHLTIYLSDHLEVYHMLSEFITSVHSIITKRSEEHTSELQSQR